MAYWSSILVRSTANNLDHDKHLKAVRADAVPVSELKAWCEKFNFVKNQVLFKMGKGAIEEHFKSVGIANTDKLVEKLNATVTSPTADIPLNANTPQQVNGPRTLVYLVNWMWLLLLDPVAPHLIKPFTEMYDPDDDGGPTGSMLSPVRHGFKTHGIAFRGDTRSYDLFTANGFTARFSEPPGHPYHVSGAYGTIAAQGMAFDRNAKDFANQTGVCIARHPIGSMKFVGARHDETDAVTSTSGYLYAVRIATGCDTEQMQRDRVLEVNNTKVLWRAGEKAVYRIPKFRFVASCQFEVDKPYSSRSGVVKFKFKRLTEWTFHQEVVAGMESYVKAATANMPVGEWRDFGTTDDWATASKPDPKKPQLMQ